MVNNSEYCVMASNRGQTSDKVHADLSERERLGLSSDTVKWGPSGMSDGFVLLTGGAPFDVICDPLFHSRPLGGLMCLSKGFISPGVPSGRVIMIDGHQATLFKGR